MTFQILLSFLFDKLVNVSSGHIGQTVTTSQKVKNHCLAPGIQNVICYIKQEKDVYLKQWVMKGFMKGNFISEKMGKINFDACVVFRL
jgi:hypothetical protein